MTTLTEPAAAQGPARVAVEAYGDSAVMVTIAAVGSAERRAQIIVMRDRFLARRPYGVTDVVSGLESLLVEFDPLLTAEEHVRFAVELLAELPGDALQRSRVSVSDFVIPVVFDAEAGEDLEEVAAEIGTDVAGLINGVTSSRLTIALLGAAMAPMMDGLQLPAPVRRRSAPRTNVVPGSIMIAGNNAIIQPFPGPSGWRVIGRTPLRIVDILRDAPVSFAPGDTVRFESISRLEAQRLDGAFLVPTAGGASE